MAKQGKKIGSAAGSRSRPGVSSPANSLFSRLFAWRENHRTVASQSIRRLLSTPLSSVMTILVLAIAITLPAALNIAVSNVAKLTGQASDSVQMSLYLDRDINHAEAVILANKIELWDGVANTRYISPDEAREGFKNIEGFSEIIDSLPTNPLPGVIVVTLSEESLSLKLADEIKSRAIAISDVTNAKIDLAWLQKVHAVIEFVQQCAAGLGLLLSIGVVLVVGNTIKLAIDNRKEEIIVTKLVGATNAFVRRPFLYMGLWFGLGGALVALILISICKLALTNAIGSISTVYGTSISIAGLGALNSLKLLLAGGVLGWLGAWLAASQHIRLLEPR